MQGNEYSSSQQQANRNQQNSLQPQGTVVQSFSRELPPTLLRINADNQDKRNICIFWVVFFAVIIIITIASSFLPKQLFRMNNQEQLRGTNLEGCVNPVGFDNNSNLLCNTNSTGNKVSSLMLNLQKQNQFAVVMWRIMLVDNKIEMKSKKYHKIAIQLTANATFYYLKQTSTNNTTSYQKYEQQSLPNQTLTLQYIKSLRIFGDDQQTVIGYSQPISALRNIQHQSRMILVQMDRNKTDLPNVSDIKIQVIVVNPEFTKYSIIIRYIFFASSLLACVLYVVMYRRVPVAERILEQKLIVVLSVLLVLFNDPFYPITILLPNKASSYFSVFVVINFVIFLQFFWIIFLDRMFYQDGQKQTKLLNWKRITYIAITYILTLILYTLIAMDFNEGLPIIRAEQIVNQKYIVLELFTIFFVMAGFIYIIFNYIRLCIKADQMLWRNQLFLFFSVFFILMTIALFFVNGFEINHLAGNRILLTFTMMNMYVFYMQYMYSISKQERERVRRGQVQHGGIGLLQVKSGDGDCVDLDFDDMIIGNKIATDTKIQEFVNRNKKKNLMHEKQEEQIYSPKYGEDYGKDLAKVGTNPKITVEEDNKTDFFKQPIQESQIQAEQIKNKKQVKNNDQFEQFSLDG